MKRRRFLRDWFGLLGVLAFSRDAFSQGSLKPFVIRIVRENGWEALMQREACIASAIYTVDSDRILSDVPGMKVCYAMELPARANKKDMSAIPNGRYSAEARISDHNGAVIELSVPGRPNIQMHAGNQIDDTLGCILVGTSAVSTKSGTGQGLLVGKCWIGGSKDARVKLLNLFGWQDLKQPPPSRPIVVIVQ